MRGAPDADVVFVAHTGLESLVSLAALWRWVPFDVRDRPLLAHSAKGDPRGEEEWTDWLFAKWERIDMWIDEHRLPEVPTIGGQVRPTARGALRPGG